MCIRDRFTHVQGLEVRHLEGTFWGIQYHPEYTVGELGSLANARIEALVREGFFLDETAAKHYVSRLMALSDDPTLKDIQWDLSLDEDVLDDDIRQRELINWLRSVNDE